MFRRLVIAGIPATTGAFAALFSSSYDSRTVWASSAVSVSTVDGSSTATKKQSRTAAVQSMPPVLAYKTRVFGNYENRIRRHSSPEKVFSYFSSVCIDGEWYMTPFDFIRTITPYNPAIDDWEVVGSSNAKFRAGAAVKPFTSAELTTLKADIALMKTGDVSAAQRVVAAFHLSKSDADVSSVDGVSSVAKRRMYESVAIPVLRSCDLNLSQFLALARSLGVAVSGDDVGIAEVTSDNEASFAALVDHDGDGLLSFGEYMLFLTILAVPAQQFELAFKMLDEDGSGSLNHNEFKKLLRIMREKHPQGTAVRDVKFMGAPGGRLDSVSGINHLFNADGVITLDAFITYVRKVQLAVREREFARCDYDGSGKLTQHEFAMYLLSFAPPDQQAEFTKRADSLQSLAASDANAITKRDFFTFCDLLLHLNDLQVALNCVTGGDVKRGVTQDEFRRCVNVVLTCIKEKKKQATASNAGNGKGATVKNNTATVKPETVTVSPTLVSVLFTLFDSNGDGALDQGEFMDVMFSRASHGLDKRRDLGIVDKLGAVGGCFKKAFLE